jgi:hypothetical protein
MTAPSKTTTSTDRACLDAMIMMHDEHGCGGWCYEEGVVDTYASGHTGRGAIE